MGLRSSATRKSSRTSLGPSPRYFWMSSEPTTRRKVAEVWLATALASKVLPVPASDSHRSRFAFRESTRNYGAFSSIRFG